jgi:hypothetical protein
VLQGEVFAQVLGSRTSEPGLKREEQCCRKSTKPNLPSRPNFPSTHCGDGRSTPCVPSTLTKHAH